MNTDSPIPAGSAKRAQPESFRGRTLSPSLTVKDLQQSLAWYRDVVGFTVDEEYEHEGKLAGVVLKAGDVRVMIGQDNGAKGWDRVKGQGLSMQITTAQNVDDIAKQIKERGGTLESEPADMPWGARIFRLQDPDGFTWTISSERM